MKKIGGTLTLHLKFKWYDMIDNYEKPEEYREMKQYWSSRFISGITKLGQPEGQIAYVFRKYARVRFYRGYTKENMLFDISSIRIGEGNPAWGAVPGEIYFIIKLGERQKD